jgi:glycosyltransferase involved in cell wall biosynthesis
VTLLLVGDGPLRGQLEAEVQRLELAQSVIFAGHQEQVYDFINMMDIFVLPSLHEGIPMVLLEALALKRPVIASRVGGIPEVVLNSRSGMLVSPANVTELASGLKEMIQDPCRARELGTMGRSQVEQEFNASMMANQTAAVYRSL